MMDVVDAQMRWMAVDAVGAVGAQTWWMWWTRLVRRRGGCGGRG